MQTIAVFSRKGGTGKTTTAINLAAGLQRAGKRTLLIDLDEQHNSTDTLVMIQYKATIYDVLRGSDIRKAIVHTQECDIIPGSDDLSVFDIWADENGKTIPYAKNKDTRTLLRTQLFNVRNDYDAVIIDCCPASSQTSIAALTAADAYIIPIESSIFGSASLSALKRTIDGIRNINPKLLNYGIIPCRYDSRTTIGKLTIEDIKKTAEQFDTLCYDPIPVCSAIPSSQYCHMSIYTYDNKCKAAAAYQKIVDELLTVL